MSRIMLKNVSMEFPRLFEPETYTDLLPPKYSSTFSFSKDNGENYTTITNAIKTAISESGLNTNEVRTLVKDGDDSGLNRFVNKWIFRCTNNGPPVVMDKYSNFVVDQIDDFYNGIVVDVVLDVAVVKTPFVKVVIGKLIAIKLQESK